MSAREPAPQYPREPEHRRACMRVCPLTTLRVCARAQILRDARVRALCTQLTIGAPRARGASFAEGDARSAPGPGSPSDRPRSARGPESHSPLSPPYQSYPVSPEIKQCAVRAS